MKTLLRNVALGICSILILSGCGGTPTSSGNSSDASITSSYSPAPVSERDPDNFIESSTVVDKTQLVVYPGPSIMESSKEVSIKVNNNDLFVYETLVNHGRVFSWTAPTTKNAVAIFDFEGKVHVDIKITREDVTVEKAIVRPLAYAYTASVKDNVISFDLDATGNYVIEYNDDPDNAIHLFANPIEKDPITQEMADADPKTIYLGPGVYNAGAFPIEDGTTIYLAGGAYVYGQFLAYENKNVTIKGRGIISGSIYSRNNDADKKIPFEMTKCTNLTIKDVAVLDPAGWAYHIQQCDGVSLENLKVISARSNGDGISLQSCSNVDVSGGFIRTWDDSLVVKDVYLSSTNHIKFHDVVVWTDLAQSMEVGYETYGATMNDISFENITVLHNYHKAVISCHNSDQAQITGLTYKNITVEDADCRGDNRDDGENDFFLDFTIQYNAEWTKSEGLRGSIDGVNIENVNFMNLNTSCTARMRGEANESMIKNVTITGLQVNGNQIDNGDQIGLTTNEYVSGVSFEKINKVTGRVITLPYALGSDVGTVETTVIPQVAQEGLIVPSFARSSGDLPYMGERFAVPGTAKATHGVGTKTAAKADDGSGDFIAEGSSAANAFDDDLNTAYTSGTWTNEDEEFAALTYDFTESTTIGAIRIKGNPNNEYSYTYRIAIYSRKIKSDGTMNENYNRLYVASDYSLTPASGNVIDINLPSQVYGGIQLRMFRTTGVDAAPYYAIHEVEFYPPSLTLGKAIVDASEHNDVYPVSKINDGDATGTSYYESKSLPAHVVIDLGDVYNLSVILFALNPSLTWTKRDQDIKVSVCADNLEYSSSMEFTTIIDRTTCTFDPATGNRVKFELEEKPQCRFLRLDIYTNTAPGGYGAQLAEVSAYGSAAH